MTVRLEDDVTLIREMRDASPLRERSKGILARIAERLKRVSPERPASGRLARRFFS
ncbi:MAG TPA: hypothetical protein VLS27_02530 [Gammaproteobacteria bacterium]|nr:hypothetical protein [Gammaproteobacteria bacterium]